MLQVAVLWARSRVPVDLIRKRAFDGDKPRTGAIAAITAVLAVGMGLGFVLVVVGLDAGFSRSLAKFLGSIGLGFALLFFCGFQIACLLAAGRRGPLNGRT